MVGGFRGLEVLPCTLGLVMSRDQSRGDVGGINPHRGFKSSTGIARGRASHGGPGGEAPQKVKDFANLGCSEVAKN
jgi:hypothetical protein